MAALPTGWGVGPRRPVGKRSARAGGVIALLAGVVGWIAAGASAGAFAEEAASSSSGDRVLSGHGGTASPQSDERDALVMRVQEAYRGLKTLRAHFEQTTRMPSLGRPRVDTGTMELARGGRMRWDFETPEVRHFISDGKTLWIYYPSQNQVMTTPLAEQASQTALNFLFGLGDLRRDFIPSPLREPTKAIPGLDALVLKPKEEIPTLKRLIIYTAPHDGLVRRALIEDYMAGETEIVFSDLHVNGSIDEERFSFVPPPGVDKLEAPGL